MQEFADVLDSAFLHHHQNITLKNIIKGSCLILSRAPETNFVKHSEAFLTVDGGFSFNLPSLLMNCLLKGSYTLQYRDCNGVFPRAVPALGTFEM